MAIQDREQDRSTEGHAGGGSGDVIERRPGASVLAAVSLVVSIGYVLMAFDMPGGSMSNPGPGMWPRTIGIAWVAISVIALAESLRPAPTAESDLFPSGKKLKLVLLFSASTLSYVVAIPIIGIYMSSGLFAIVIMGIMQEKWTIKTVIYGILFGGGVSFIFVEILSVRLPGFPWG